MRVPFRTFALFGLAVGMLAAGYLFVPAPGASTTLPARPGAKDGAPPQQVQTQAHAKSAPAVVAQRPPVPLVTQPRATNVEQAPGLAATPAAATASVTEKPTVNMGTFSTNPPDPNDRTQALLAPPAGAPGSDSKARRAIEFDGYKNVRDLVQGPDGVWRGRALRGRTEIAVRVDASGNVSAE